MLGDAVYHAFCGEYVVRATDIDLNAEWLFELDVRDTDAVRREIETFRPQVVVNLAALTDLEHCERHAGEAHATNARSTAAMAALCRDHDLLLVHISTAGVFDGAKDSYTEEDQPAPLNVYGQSKYEGELAVRDTLDRYFIFRAGWMMGGGPSRDKKFINKIMKQIRAGSEELFVVDDKAGSPTYTHDFARNLRAMLATDHYGLYHMAGQGECSRLEVARHLLAILGLQETIELTPVGSDHFRQEYFAARPASEQLVNARLNALGVNLMRDWRESLAEYLHRHDWNLAQVALEDEQS